MSHQPRKRFGQHFLHDRSVIQHIVDAVNPDEQVPIVEIGPGLGALTLPLLQRVAALDVVEIDRDLAQALADKCHNIGDLRIHQGDALKFEFCTLHNEKIKIIGNLPYNISTPLLFHLLKQINCINSMVFMMQKEVVERICAEKDSKHYGRLTVMIQSQCHVEKLLTIGAGAFTPPPKVESSVIRLRPLAYGQFQIMDNDLFSQIVKLAFNYRRKTLRNALRGLVDESIFGELGIASTSRAENLTIREFAAMANYLYKLNNQ